MTGVVADGMLAVSLVGWLLYLRETERTADLHDDLCRVIHDGLVDRDDLRRSLDHDEVRDALERRDS